MNILDVPWGFNFRIGAIQAFDGIVSNMEIWILKNCGYFPIDTNLSSGQNQNKEEKISEVLNLRIYQVVDNFYVNRKNKSTGGIISFG